MNKPILDVCCGSRMMYFNKKDPRVVFGDNRSLETTLCDGRKLEINPGVRLDFTSLPFADNTFGLVVFDPPHLIHAGQNSWLAKKYGVLGQNWQDDLKAGFKECFRVLKHEGTLIFKWNEYQIKVREILALTDQKPVFGHPTNRAQTTHWFTFMKD